MVKPFLTLSFITLLGIAIQGRASDAALANVGITPPPIQESSSAEAISTPAPVTAVAPVSTPLPQSASNQKPHATILTCSDSPVQTNMLNKTPAANLFMISNIGNQLLTSLGSVEYGVNYLGSSLLLIVGHSNCKAIHTANSDYSKLKPALVKELNNMRVVKGAPDNDSVKANVNNQVAIALQEFAAKVKNGQLLIVGAIYEFNDDAQANDEGKLNIININGETDPVKLSAIAATVAQAQ
ncbi:carbonic anhydrase [Legionella tunisiensis]|uniref:carbonic anhydrase n=1 Tax=Legionella tunisiensis TaxID=1034944 RepID=UPI0002DE6B5C|nr:carbonic anhydrase [Legionella tunisiensis]